MKLSVLLAFFLVVSLAGCDDSPESAPKIGSETPGGYVITDNGIFVSIDNCIDNSKMLQSKMNILKVDDVRGNTMYTSQIKLASGDMMLHACVEANKQVVFTEAIKKK
ncbi:hypothetical protein GCM10007897_06250 [Sphingobium jiangsuense]|nr:hypothetical protein [Sphingobium jiangsuense]GLS99246.1 hypothetical protein GCM10007897_06250 [Sphingobium jiangsuense]